MRFKHSLALIAAISALDRFTKWAFRDAKRELIPGLLSLRGIRNTGAAFGMLSGLPWLLTAVSALALMALMIYLYKERPRGLFGLGLSLVAAGTLGNLLDRLLLGHVIDFIQFTFISFPVFNVADIAVTLGCALCLMGLLFHKEGGHA